MITTEDAQRALDILRGAGVAGLRDADPSVWAMVVNAAPLTVTVRGQREPVADSTGRVVRLDPRPEEVVPAATRMASLGVRLPQAADLAAAVQDRRDGDRAVRSARVAADAERHGPLVPEGLGGDVEAELAWRRYATAAIGAGATRAQAEAHAWKRIGRRRPALPAGGDVLGGLAGAERAREVLRRLASTPEARPLPPRAGERGAGGGAPTGGPVRLSESLTRARAGQGGGTDGSPTTPEITKASQPVTSGCATSRGRDSIVPSAGQAEQEWVGHGGNR